MKTASRILFMVAFLLAQFCWGQTSKGTIAGVVTDQSGAVIPNADVMAKDELGAETRAVKTGTSGEYRIEAINPSTYTVTVKAGGFATKAVNGLVVSGSIVTSLNVRLDVGGLQQTVSVEATAAQIHTESGELAGTVSSKEITELPIGSLNPISLVLTQPGVVAVAGRDNMTNGAGFSVNGLRPRENNFLIDSFDNNDAAIAGQALQPGNVEAYSDVITLKNSYAPEFGRGGASVTNVLTKNGTNNYHATLWERYEGSGLNAIDPASKRSGATSVPRYDTNTYGFTAGGPAIKNKLFFFGSSQWTKTAGQETGAQLTIPTAQGVQVLQGLAATYPNAGIIVSSLGGLVAPTANSTINAGNRAGCGSPCLIPVGVETRAVPQQSSGYEWIARADYTASEKDTYSARYIGTQSSLSPDFFANGGTLPTQDTEQGGPARNLGIFWTHVFSPTMVNEVRVTAQTINFAFSPTAATAANPLWNTATVTIAGLGGFYGGGSQATFPQGRGHDTYQYQEAFSWTAGTHTMKMGADVAHYAINDIIPFNALGTLGITKGGNCLAIGLPGTNGCTGLANFLDNYTGPAGTYGKQFGNPFVSMAQNTMAFYTQDNWKIKSNLTLNYGVRWEYFATPFNALPYPAVNNATVLTDPLGTRVKQLPDRNNWGPRLGFAYTPKFLKGLLGDGKTVFRGGAGLFYDPFFTNITQNVASSAPNTLGGTFVATTVDRGLPNASTLIPGATASLNPKASVSIIDANFYAPQIYQWNFNVERELPADMLLTVAYVGTRGEHLFASREMNPGIDNVRLNPNRGVMGERNNTGDSIYHGLQTGLDRRFKNGLMYRIAYTFSKSIDNVSEVFTSSGGTQYASNAFNWAADRGPSAFDRTHRAALTWVYDMPFRLNNGHGASQVLQYIARNWSFSGSFQVQSGAPDTIYMTGWDSNHDLRTNNDRPTVINLSAPINYSEACIGSSTCITGVGEQTSPGTIIDWMTGAPVTDLSKLRYLVIDGGQGNIGRNTFRNDWTNSLNIAVQRIFPIPHTEHHQLELRVEAFNPLNHAYTGIVSANISSTNFMNTDVVKTDSRWLALWVKYRF